MINGMVLKPYLLMSIAALVLLAGVSVIPASAQEDENSMIMTTSKGSLDIKLEPILLNSTDARFRVSFLNPGTETLHQHQDYDFRILQDGQEIFSAAKQTNQPLIHNVEGTISVPYNFATTGEYSIEVQILGLGFGPTLVPTEENAAFPIKVIPEFPAGVIVAISALMVGSIALTRRYKLF